MKQIRKCQACGEYKTKEELIKITKLQDGSLKINPTSKELGRSLYVCKNKNCVQVLIKKKRIKSVLKYSNQEIIQNIEKDLFLMVDKM